MSAAAARKGATNIMRSGIALAARVIPSAAAGEAIEARLAFEKAARSERVSGLIVKYKNADWVAMAEGNGILPPEELTALRAISDAPITGSRAMAGGAFVLKLAQRRASPNNRLHASRVCSGVA